MIRVSHRESESELARMEADQFLPPADTDLRMGESPEANDLALAARIAGRGHLTILAGEELALESGIPARPTSAGWELYGPRMRIIHAAQPGAGHQAARRLQDGGCLLGVVTDADDVLFEEAGVRNVVPIRGSVASSICERCGYSEPLGCVLELLPHPTCAACGGVLRPDVSVSGMQVRPDRVDRARTLMEAAHTVLQIGSPAADGRAPTDVGPGAIYVDLGRERPGERLAAVALQVRRLLCE